MGGKITGWAPGDQTGVKNWQQVEEAAVAIEAASKLQTAQTVSRCGYSLWLRYYPRGMMLRLFTCQVSS